MTTTHFNVTDFGAIGDGITKATSALQNAIDVCHNSGGGKVLLPAGDYLSGSIYLKSNVELHLAAGARIVGSADLEDYNAEDIFPENIAFSSENVTARHLIIAYRQENISITGQGTIDGNSAQLFDPLPEHISASYRFKAGNFPIRNSRPGQMIFFCRCQNVSASDVQLVNSPYWTFFLLGCKDVQIRNIFIENPPATQNGDGIDIDCCKNVTISDCIIRSGDDSITVRGNSRKLGEGDWICENVVVTNCILSTPCNAIRIGVGDGHIRKVLFNNINIPDASRGISIISLYRKTNNSHHGTRIEDIHFSDFLMDVDVPFTIDTGHGSEHPATIDDISLRNFKIIAQAGAQLVGTSETPIGKVLFQNIDWLVHAGSENREFHDELPVPLSHHGYRGRNGGPALPCALFATYTTNLQMDHFELRWKIPSAVWRDGILLRNMTGVDLHNLYLSQPQSDSGTAISCQDVQEITIRNSRAAAGTSTFLSISNTNKSTFIRHGGNDFSGAKTPLHTKENQVILKSLRDLQDS